MLDAKKARIEELKLRFNREFEERSPEVHSAGQEYLEALVGFLDTVDHGPVTDPNIASVDTTGTINRTEEYAEWVAQEHARVRRLMREVR